ncbi:ferredoxin--NADP reductase [Uliginosibacterium sp. H3]|uniref:ferredoxin--NADP(+) reductase n=1 Tax=Uliginosibacterium silvisoli TaxID=3114758 RepID=A0ABU6K8N3_9RHOO|nr:ferredoxin--NADP reductase [Uliginosibacterium sp. H3]
MSSVNSQPGAAPDALPGALSKLRWSAQPVLHIRQWAPTLWTLRVARPEGFTFTPGHYAKLGLPVGDEAAVWRAYSIVSAPAENFLEFLITWVPDGAMSMQLEKLEVGDALMVQSAAMGFFVASQLGGGVAHGDSLWMLSTGSGLGPYVSMLREGSLATQYRKLIVVHSARTQAELAYADEFRELAARHTSVEYVPIVTREAGHSALSGRIPLLIDSGTLAAHVGEQFDASTARVMVCGNPDFTGDMRRLLTARNFQPCRRGLVGSMLFENYW